MTTQFPYFASNFGTEGEHISPLPNQPARLRMKAGDASKWLSALRSGKYTQARGELFCQENGGFCCLGVLEHSVCGDVENRGFPTTDWMTKNHVHFFKNYDFDSNDITFQIQVHREDGRLVLEWTSASGLNDAQVPFAVIADLIEPLIETY